MFPGPSAKKQLHFQLVCFSARQSRIWTTDHYHSKENVNLLTNQPVFCSLGVRSVPAGWSLSVCLSGRAGWQRWRGGCRHGRSSPGARAGSTRHRTHQEWTAVPRTGRGTVSVQAGAHRHTRGSAASPCLSLPQRAAVWLWWAVWQPPRSLLWSSAFWQLLMVKGRVLTYL